MVHLYVRTSLVSFLMLIFLSFGASSYATKVVKVDALCKQTKNPSFCSNILNSYPGGAAGVDLVTLAKYTIKVARANITNTINLIKHLIAQSASDSTAKNHYESCLLHFNYDEGALGDIEYTEQMLNTGDYEGVNVAAAAVTTDVDNCVSGESPSDPPYQDPSLLPQYAGVVEQVVAIIIVISNYLLQN